MVDYQWFSFFDGNTDFAGYIGVNHDITRRRIAEDANREHLEKINEYQKKLKNLYYELTLEQLMVYISSRFINSGYFF